MTLLAAYNLPCAIAFGAMLPATAMLVRPLGRILPQDETAAD